MIVDKANAYPLQIVPYQSLTFQDLVEDFIQRISKHSLQSDLPLQQKHLKRSIISHIYHPTLPYSIFCAILPQAVSLSKPKDRINLLFAHFKQIAETPRELCNRMYWAQRNGIHPENGSCIPVVSMTRCGLTNKALFASIFGNDESQYEVLFDYDLLENETAYSKVVTAIENHALILKESATFDFFAYSFHIYAKTLPLNYYGETWGIGRKHFFSGHAFTVIQYVDEHHEIKYRIFQSFLDRYCLKDYLEETNNVFNAEEFKIFLDGLKNLLLSNQWTDTLEKFYTMQFRDKEGFVVGKENPCKSAFKLKWKRGNIYDILIQNRIFKSFMEMPEAPKMCMGSCGRCQNKLKGITLVEADVAEEKRELEIVDQQLRWMYDKQPLKNKLSLTYELESLGLDLTEEGIIKIPARDANGTLILNGKNVVFIDRPIALRKAVKDVIRSLNNSFHNRSFHVLGEKIELYLDPGKEPLKTYEASGWLPRIIEALIHKTPDSNLESKPSDNWKFYQLRFPSSILS